MKIHLSRISANAGTKLSAMAALIALLLTVSGCEKLKARDQLSKGVQAFKNTKYEQASNYFAEASKLDPSLTVARLYHATAEVAQYAPGGDSPENLHHADMAIQEYKQVLTVEPSNILSTKGLASLYFKMNKFDDAKEYNKQAIKLDPNDPENYYSIGVIDWTTSYQTRMDARTKLGLKIDDGTPQHRPQSLINEKKVCPDVKDKNSANVAEGIEMLTKAIQLRDEYDDAMAFINLMYRERADIQCGDKAAYEADWKTADDWVDKAMAVKKVKAEREAKKHASGIVLDPDKDK
jgi:tetratricopeptide (TPR) repeat protein